MNVAIYVRSARMSPVAQVRLNKLKEFANSQPDWKLVGEYVDNGFSGNDDKRPEFNYISNAVEAKHIDLILVESISQLTRKPDTFVKLQSLIDRNGCKLYDLSKEAQNDDK